MIETFRNAIESFFLAFASDVQEITTLDYLIPLSIFLVLGICLKYLGGAKDV